MKALFLSVLPLAWSQNMNPFDYTISNPPSGRQGQPYNFIGEYFEIRSDPIRNNYSQVFWGTLGPNPLPEAIVQRFKGKLIAFRGFEVDVMRNVSGKEEPVPCYQSYNHHYQPIIGSPYAQFSMHKHGKVSSSNPHGMFHTFDVIGDPPSNVHLAQDFVHGNGNEHRQIYHGLPDGFVQSVYSPDHFLISSMQINTNDGSNTKGPHGPVPKLSRMNLPPNTPFSPLIECPITDRVQKTAGGVNTQVTSVCGKNAVVMSECFPAVYGVLGEQVVKNVSVNNNEFPSGCNVMRMSDGKSFSAVYNNNTNSSVMCGDNSTEKGHIAGSQLSLVGVSVDVDETKGLVTISLSGPASVWYGVGWGAIMMQDTPYTIIVDGNGNVTERKLLDHDPGKQLETSVKILNISVIQDTRTVILQRALQGLTSDYYSFSAAAATIPFINALGNTAQFAQHVNRSSSSLRMFEVSAAPTCVCAAGRGAIDGIPYDPNCKPRPWSDLLAENNPVCDAMTYQGGLATCRGFLLDSDQPIPQFEDEVYFKFRFYFTDFDSSMREIYHVEWAVNGCDSGAFGPNPLSCTSIEFDVVKGTNSSFGPDIAAYSSRFPVRGLLEEQCSMQSVQCMDASLATNGIELILAASHCHAPNCLKQELYNADTGELLCVALPVQGKSANVYDEQGYLFAPPCVWGDEKDGFLPPPHLQLDTNMTMIAYYNSTYTHTGQMGIWQMKAAFAL